MSLLISPSLRPVLSFPVLYKMATIFTSGGVEMVLGFKKSVCIGLLLVTSAAFVFASVNPISILIKPAAETVKAFRYQTGIEPGNSWIEVDIPCPSLVLDGFDSSKDVLYIQQSGDLLTWSDVYEYRYNPTANTWEVSLATPKKTSLVDSVDVKIYGLLPYGRSTTCYSHVLGAGLRANFTLGRDEGFIGYSEITYSRGPSESDWADSMQAVGVSVGMGYRIPLGSKAGISPELGYGVLFHLLNADLDQDGENSLELFIDQQVRLSLNLSYQFGNGYEMFLAPLGVLFFQNGDIGTMFGIQSGIRIKF